MTKQELAPAGTQAVQTPQSAANDQGPKLSPAAQRRLRERLTMRLPVAGAPLFHAHRA